MVGDDASSVLAHASSSEGTESSFDAATQCSVLPRSPRMMLREVLHRGVMKHLREHVMAELAELIAELIDWTIRANDRFIA